MPQLIKKLHPRQFPGMSVKMASIVGLILGETFTSPCLNNIIVLSDGYVMGQRAGDCGHNDFIGRIADLRRNWRELLDATELTDNEKAEANALFIVRIGVNP